MKWPLSVPSGTMAKPRGAVNSQVGQRPRTPASNSRWRDAGGGRRLQSDSPALRGKPLLAQFPALGTPG